MHDGNEIRFEPPLDPAVWYAPETLVWALLLLLAPLTAVVLLRVFGALRSARSSSQASDRSEEVEQETPTDPGLAFTGWAFLYSLLLAAAAVWATRVMQPGKDLVVLAPTAGRVAGGALLLLPALALFVATLVSGLAAGHYAAAVPGTGLLSVIWLIAGGAGCVFAGGIAAAAGVPSTFRWLLLGAILILIGLMRRRVYIDGLTIAERARRAEDAAHREEGEQAAASCSPSGEYVGESRFRYWGRIIGFGSFLPGGTLVMSLIGFGAGDPNAFPDLGFWLYSLGMGSAFGLVLYLFVAATARTVTWDKDGVMVAWYRGEPRHFAWSELVSLKLTHQHRAEAATVHVSSGEKWVVVDNGAGYGEFLVALKARVWTRVESESEPEADHP